MHSRTALCLFLLGASALAQTAPPEVPAPARRYLDILLKRPQPGTLFERFHAAWLEEGTTADLGAFLDARAKAPSATAADHLLLAVFHSHRGDDPSALKAYETALKLDPANTSAWIERSRLEARALDFASALHSLDEGAKAHPDAAAAMEISKLRGRALLRLGKNEEALRTWKELAAAHAEDEDLSEELIDLLTDEGQYEAALETAQALIKRSRDPVARTLRQLRLTDVLLLAERRDDALKTLRETLASTGSDSWIEGDVLGRISRVFRMSDDLEGFEKFMAGLVKEHPQRVALAWQHTLLLGETGQKDASLKEARALLQSNPGRRDLQEGFLDLLESLDLTHEAIEQAQTLAQQNAADKEMLVRLAGLQHRAKDDAAARATLERFLKLPGAAEADYLRAARLLENWEEPPVKPGSPAAQAYAQLVERFPESLSAQEAQAHYLHRAGQRDAALAIWTRLAKSAALEDLLRIVQALQARQESRTALDLLAPRQQDFAREPRLYALLVQLGIANKEIERALPWARTRLGLAQDAESIETAVKDLLLVLRSDESGKLTPPVLQELQGQAAATIQNRCLLAALLENAGKHAEAEKALTSAPAEDQLTALSQLATLLQTRQEWEKAAQTLQQVIALPGARTTARVQRMVDFYRRAEKPEQALTWVAEWKKLSPSAVQPWLDESRLLLGLNRTKDALGLLRDAMRKFPDSIEMASSYASLCLENNQPDEAERTYLALYEKTADAAARLRLISPLTLAAQQHNNVPRLIENFQQRQKQNRASAQPWLALAEIYRAVNNDEERRRCLYEASRLRPQDLALLLDIARSEEEIGLTAEALRTLESAAKLDKTTKARESIARLQIESGDPDLGYRMLFEIAGGSQMDARSIEQMADTIAEKGEWDRVITFLDPLLAKHPQDYRLHYLNAVALEEAGREKEAVRAFIEIMGMHEELPGVTTAGRSIGLRAQYSTLSLPPGTEDWLVLPAMVQAAYVHRQKQGGRASFGSYNTFGSNFSNGLPSNGYVQQAPGVTESPVLALAHVLQIVTLWDVAEREPTLRSLRQAGVSDAPLLLAAAESSPQLVITSEMLAEQPQNVALHAAWLMQARNDSPEEFLPVYDRAYKLFQSNYPALAMRTATMAWHAAGAQSPVWVRRILDLHAAMPKVTPDMIRSLSSLLRSQSDLFPQEPQNADTAKISPEDVRAITTLLKRWVSSADSQPSYYVADVVYSLGAVRDWAGMVEIIQQQLDQPEKPQNKAQAAGSLSISGRTPQGYYRNFRPAALPMPAISVSLPTVVLNLIASSGAQQDYDQAPVNEAQQKWIKEFHAGLNPFVEKAQNPKLKLTLRLMTGQQQALLDEMAPRLTANPSLDDLLLAGWLSQQMNRSEKALSYFQQARALSTDSAQILQLELAILHHAQRMLQKPGNNGTGDLMATIKPVIEHLTQTASNQNERYMLAEALNALGMEEEAENLAQAAQGSQPTSRPQNTPVVANPYSRSYSYRQRQQKKQVSLDEMVRTGDEAAAVKELVRQLRLAIQGCLSPQNSSSAHHQIHDVINRFGQYKLTDQVMKTMETAASAGWKPRQEYAVLLEHTGLETKPAIEAHRAVVAANPRAFASHARLATLFALEGDFQTALQHWQQMPEVTQAAHLPALIHEFNESSSISIPRPAALSGLLSVWLRSLPANRPLSAGITQNFSQALSNLQNGVSSENVAFPALWQPPGGGSPQNDRRWSLNEDGSIKLSPESQKARDERRAAHDQLCKAMTGVPELALMGFAPLGGLAMAESGSLADTEKMALELLSLRTMPKVRRRLMSQWNYSQGYGGTDPVSPYGGMFATQRQIAMPVPAVFATYSAALRGDQRLLGEVIFPAILKAEGKNTEEYCRAYAALIMADDAHFVSAASAWLNPAGKGIYAHRSQQQGGPLEEIVRLWQKRQIKEPLNELFLSQTSPQAYSVPQPLNSYAFALGERNPEALRSFIRSLRDRWIGGTPELRTQNITAWREYQKQQQSNSRRFYSSFSPALQSVQNYIQWLQNLLEDPRALPLLDLALEDDLISSDNWLAQIARRYTSDRFQTIDDFLQTADTLGFLGEPASFRTYVLNDGENHSTWFGSLAHHYRDRWNDEKVNQALARLGQRKPTLGNELAQALLVKNSRTPMQLDGRPAPLEVTQFSSSQFVGDDSDAYCSAALRIVLLRHPKDIAAMPQTGQAELATLLRRELSGYPHPELMGEELTRVLAPLLKIESQELTRKIDQVLAAKSWSDLRQQEQQFTQQFPALLRDFASVDAGKAAAAVRHAVKLLHDSPEQKVAVVRNGSENLVYRLLTSLAEVPQLLHVTSAIAKEEGISHVPGWTSNLRSQMEQLLHQPKNVGLVFSGTPWMAEASGYMDPAGGNDETPTLLACLVNRIENDTGLSTLVPDILKKQPATFGTELLLAFLQRSTADNPNARSFYYSNRPDPSPILDFIKKRQADFASLQPESAASLLAMLRARMPDLDQKTDQDSALKQALQPLVIADKAEFENAVSSWMQMTRLGNSANDIYGVIKTGVSLLDRLAQSETPRAVALLDQISKLVAQQDALYNRGSRQRQPHQTQVAQWLQNAAAIPELFGAVMERAEQSGAATDPSWLETTLRNAGNLYKHRGSPRRVIALLEATGMLAPAATFNPRPLPKNSQQVTLLEFMSSEFTGGSSQPGLVEELAKRQPRTFGVDLITLLCSKRYNAQDEIAAFAQAHADEIATCSTEQKKLLAGYFQRRKWAEAFAANVPALQEEFAPLVKEQQDRLQTFIDDLLKIKTWRELEAIYIKSLPPAVQSRYDLRMPGGMQYYSTGGLGYLGYFADQLQQMGKTDANRVAQSLQLIGSLYRTEFSQSPTPYRMPPLNEFVLKLCSSPRLAPKALQFGAQNLGGQNGVWATSRGNMPLNEHQLISVALPKEIVASAEKLVPSLEEMGLLANAATYDAFPLPGFRMRSVLALTLNHLSSLSPDQLEKTAQFLISQKGAKFGHYLIAACLTAKDSPERNRRLELCAAHFTKLNLETAGAVLDVFEKQFPELATTEQAGDGLRHFAPLLQLRSAEERSYLNALLAGQRNAATPFRGYTMVVRNELVRLMAASRKEDALKLISALSRSLEPEDTSSSFGKAPYFRVGGAVSYFLQSQLRINADDTPVLLACQMLAASSLPEVRIMADTLYTQNAVAGAGLLFQIWEQRGGWAAPRAVWADFMQQVAPHASTGARGLWLPVLHSALSQMGRTERRAVADWAAEKVEPALQTIRHECRLALDLLESTELMPGWPDGPYKPLSSSPAALKTFSAATTQVRALLKDEQVRPHVRLALAAWLTATHPGLLDQEERQSWGLAAATAWHENVPITRFELGFLLNSAAVLPHTETWQQISGLALERWDQLEAIMNSNRTRYRDSVLNSAIFRLAAGSENTSALNPILNLYGKNDVVESTGLLLENNQWQRVGSLKLRSAPISHTSGIKRRWWLPPTDATLRELQAGNLEDGLLAELVALTADDTATHILYPDSRIPSRTERLAAFAKKVASLPLPQQPVQRAQTLVLLGREQPESALLLLPQFEALGKVFTSSSLGDDSFSENCWLDFLAVHAALKIAKGDMKAADTHLERLRTDPGFIKRHGRSYDYQLGSYRSTLLQCLAPLWQAGLARDPEKVLQFASLAGAPANTGEYDYLSHAVLKSAISAWHATLKKEPLPTGTADSTFSLSNITGLMELMAAMSGTGKNRLSFQQRLELVTRTTWRIRFFTGNIWQQLIQHQVFSQQELIKNSDSVLKASPCFAAGQLEDYAHLMRGHGMHQHAAQFYALAGEQWSRAKNPSSYYANRCVLACVEMHIRHGDLEAATRSLSQFNAAASSSLERSRQPALLRLLSQSAPAPAK